MLRLVLPKGSLERATLELFEAADLAVSRSSGVDYRATVDDPRIDEVRILRPQEIPTYVAEGLFDIGITGRDWIEETASEVATLGELHYSKATARPVNVDGMPVPALAPTDVLTSKLLALNEGHLDFEGLLAMVRGVREQVDWDELRRRTEAQPLARSFLYLAGELGLTPEPEPEPARLAKGA